MYLSSAKLQILKIHTNLRNILYNQIRNRTRVGLFDLLQDVNLLRQLYLTAGAMAAVAALYYLYQRQLGAISFFILSIFFFFLAFALLSKSKKNKHEGNIGSEKTEENDR